MSKVDKMNKIFNKIKTMRCNKCEYSSYNKEYKCLICARGSSIPIEFTKIKCQHFKRRDS